MFTLETIKTNVLKPLTGRVGTFVSGYLLTYGVQSDTSHAIGAGVAAASLVLGDLFLSWLGRKEVARKVLADAGR